jgi:hypothetical protein
MHEEVVTVERTLVQLYISTYLHTCIHTHKYIQVEEVVAVERALVQLGVLLQRGYGEAGAKIIRSSLKVRECVYTRVK